MAARPMFNFFVFKKIERRSCCHKLSAFTATGDCSKVELTRPWSSLAHATGDGFKVEPRVLKKISKRRARGSTLEASVVALKTTIHERSCLHARGSTYALASVREELNHLLWHARGSTLEPSSVAAKADNLWQRYLRSIFFNTKKLNIGLAALNYLRFLNVLYNLRKP